MRNWTDKYDLVINGRLVHYTLICVSVVPDFPARSANVLLTNRAAHPTTFTRLFPLSCLPFLVVAIAHLTIAASLT